uniref:L,D-transpeptidase family protein n=1 Tax=Vibrio cholerae TaxID=666 RepID=UPI0021AE558B
NFDVFIKNLLRLWYEKILLLTSVNLWGDYLGKSPKGHKQQEGDQRTPEGHYLLDFIIEDSSFYRSIHISYPNTSDQQLAQLRGVNPGGDIKIHGLKNGDEREPGFVQSFDWTNGCIAITNQEMDEFLSLVQPGVPIHIEW